MKIKRWYGEHEGGTKFYEVICAQVGVESVVIQRWGPIGKFGQTKHTTYGRGIGESQAAVVVNGKIKRGYRFTDEIANVDNGAQIGAYLQRVHNTVSRDFQRLMLELLEIAGPDDTFATPAKREPEPELARNEHWGSW